jgi:hypothetical protein
MPPVKPSPERQSSMDVRWNVVPEGLSSPTGQQQEERAKEQVPGDDVLQAAREELIFTEDSEVSALADDKGVKI